LSFFTHTAENPQDWPTQLLWIGGQQLSERWPALKYWI